MNVDQVLASTGRHAPSKLLKQALGLALGGLSVSLCLHRVAEVRRATDWQPYLSMPPSELDALIELLLGSRKAKEARWLSVTFDDGYADAAEYISQRARKYPEVEWIFFLCPRKTETRTGFRWDLIEQGKATAREIHDAPDLQREAERQDLRQLPEDERFQLASVEACRELQGFANVSLGNHTNHHFRQTTLTLEQAREEYATSTRDFERLFGPQRHFAFPFGTPGYEFGAEHVQELRRVSSEAVLWSTERRPFRSSERVAGAVLPRFPVNGTWEHRPLAAWIAGRAGIFRARGTPHAFPLAPQR